VPNGSGGTTLAGGYYDINNQPIVDKTDANRASSSPTARTAPRC
jgi:hypothetical protein